MVKLTEKCICGAEFSYEHGYSGDSSMKEALEEWREQHLCSKRPVKYQIVGNMTPLKEMIRNMKS